MFKIANVFYHVFCNKGVQVFRKFLNDNYICLIVAEVITLIKVF